MVRAVGKSRSADHFIDKLAFSFTFCLHLAWHLVSGLFELGNLGGFLRSFLFYFALEDTELGFQELPVDFVYSTRVRSTNDIPRTPCILRTWHINPVHNRHCSLIRCLRFRAISGDTL
jgi:hypothetical protein